MKHTYKPETKDRWGRFKLIGAGLVLSGVGAARILVGEQVVRHSNGQPMFSWGLVAAGLLCFLLAFVPASWVARAAEIPKAKTGHKR